MKELSRDFKGVWIPREIWLHEGLPIKSKVFLAEIHSLTSNEHGYCWAGNEHFAMFSGLSKNACSKTISALEKEGFIRVELIYNGKQIDERRIYILDYGGCSQNDKGGIAKMTIPCSQNDKGSNTINNTLNKELLRNSRALENSAGNSCNDVETKNSKKTIDSTQRASLRKTKLNSAKTTKNIAKPVEHKKIPIRIIKLIEYWNSFGVLGNVTLVNTGKRTPVYYLDEQRKVAQRLAQVIQDTLSGKFYSKFSIDKKFLPAKINLPDIRTAIEKCARDCSLECRRKEYRMTMEKFFHSGGNKGTGREKYKFMYSLIHWLHNTPKPLTLSRHKVKTEYSTTVERVLTVLKIKGDNQAYNRVAKYVDTAVVLLKKRSNGNFHSNLGELSQRVKEGVSGPLTLDNLHWGFQNLESTYAKHLKFHD